MKTQRQRPLVFFFTTSGGGYKMEATTSLSLSHALYNFSYNFQQLQYKSNCPKSYLYIYDFSAYLHMCPSNRSEPIGTGSEISRFSVSSIQRDMFPNKWQPYLAGAQHRIQVLTDHKNLIYFTTTRTINRRQAHWSSFLADYDFEILFGPGIQHGKAEILSRRSDFALHPSDDAYSQQSHCLLRPNQRQMFATYMLHDNSLLNEITQATTTGPFATDIMALLNNPSQEMQSSDRSFYNSGWATLS